MDKTLLSVSSATLWARHLRERGELPLGDLLRIVSALVRYKLGQLDMAETTRRFVLDLAGQSEDMHEANTRRWVADQLVNYVAEEGRQWVELQHRRLGHRVALITASPWYTADPLARALGMAPEDVLATRSSRSRTVDLPGVCWNRCFTVPASFQPPLRMPVITG